ncbi:hypothetical protein RchiOBHm_Chr2g0171791 [Rosa chinensis]|uniref:Uncharacterized protein n=1 Tax=Rosa chinensis TaxID=74649 RepID=A0A2P6S5G8_ROSCH|nr:hypothetical protein RchiOBHm_Chr2g0171791 [Rosa chinensis]
MLALFPCSISLSFLLFWFLCRSGSLSLSISGTMGAPKIAV